MKATMTAVAVSLLACYGTSVAQETGTAGEDERAEGIPATPHQAGTAREVESYLFRKLDEDGDDAISRQEAEGHSKLKENWSRYDQDGDDMLSSREFGDFRAEESVASGAAEPSVTEPSVAGAAEQSQTGVAGGLPETRHQEQTVGGDLVGQLDTDGDGRISQQEAQGEAQLAENWDEYDQDGDGQLDGTELDRLEEELRDTEEAE